MYVFSKNLSKTLTIRESQSAKGVKETVKPSSFLFASTGVIGEKFPDIVNFSYVYFKQKPNILISSTMQ